MNRRTRALCIPEKVKRAVAKRDGAGGHPCCIWCGRPAPTEYELAYSNAHYISRAQGGLGIEENILTLCPECHIMYDQGAMRKKMREWFKAHLKSKYPNWDEEKLIYRKGE